MVQGYLLNGDGLYDAELAKCESWGTSNKSIRGLFDSQRAFETTKGSGVGQTTILKFLGGNWKQWMIQEALEIINDDGPVDREAFESFSSMKQAQAFKNCQHLPHLAFVRAWVRKQQGRRNLDENSSKLSIDDFAGLGIKE